MRVKVLFVETGSELDGTIQPNTSILAGELKNQINAEIAFFCTNFYRDDFLGGDCDKSAVQSLQVIPTKQIYYYKNESMIDDFQKIIKEFKPDIIGFSVVEIVYKRFIKLLNSINNDSVYVIVGGKFPILCPDLFLGHERINAICVGECEKIFPKLCQSIKDGDIDYNTPNFWFRDKDGDIIKNSVSYIADINNIEFQDWSSFERDRSYRGMNGKIRKLAQVEFARGCPYKCSYCANYFLNTQGFSPRREKDIDRFINEVIYLKKIYNIDFVYIIDENFLLISKKKLYEFSEKFSSLSMPFWVETQPDLVDKKVMKSLIKSGLELISFGVDSGNYEYRKNVLNRFVKDDEIINGIRIASECGANVYANIIIGFPGETRDLIFDSIELMRECNPFAVSVHCFTPFSKTLLREKAIKYELIDDDYICTDYRHSSLGTGILSKEEISGLFRTFNLYVKFSKNRWSEIRRAEIFDDEGNEKFLELAREYQLKYF